MISVIIPVYNSAAQLPRCIESVLAQTYSDFELLLLDDGSSDNSYDVCRKYEAQDHRVHAFTHENSGVSATRNWGLELARGEYVQFIDSDDYIQANMMEALLSAMNEGNADLVICGLKEANAQGAWLNLPSIQKTIPLLALESEYPDIFEHYLLNSPCNKLYQKEKITHLFSKSLSMGEDLLFNLEYMHNVERIAFVQEALYVYDCTDDGLVHKKRPDAIDIAHLLYLKSMEFKERVHLGDMAKMHISNIFITFLFYGLAECYSTPEKSARDKRAVLKKWANDPDVREALQNARLPQKKQQIAHFLLQHRLLFCMHVLMCLLAYAKR